LNRDAAAAFHASEFGGGTAGRDPPMADDTGVKQQAPVSEVLTAVDVRQNAEIERS